MNNKSFRLFASCKIVKGAAQATICDLQRGKVYPIPIELADFLEKTKSSNTSNNIKAFSKDDQETVQEYLHFFEKNELGFWTDEPERFPELNMQWKSPETINNAIIEIEKLSFDDIKKITTSLTNLRCKFVEIRLYNNPDIEKIAFFADHCKESVIRSIIVYLPFRDQDNFEGIDKLSKKYPRIRMLILHSFNKSESFETKNPKIRITSKKIDNRNCCGIIDPKLFTIKIPVFTESLQFNSCLNKKLSIDIEGNIKNCPSMPSVFGNIKNDTIEDIVKTKNFQLVWSINKDKISICKDCEFRHVCTDCRAYTEDPDNLYSKPLKCGYDPYTNKWEDWSTNPLKKEAIKYYSFQNFLNG